MQRRACNTKKFDGFGARRPAAGMAVAAQRVIERGRWRGCAAVVAGLIACTAAMPAGAQQPAVIAAPPFVTTLSNTAPLAFGMDETQAAQALGMPLNYLGGRPGDEIYLVIRTHGGSGFFNRRDRLYLQFRHGRLAGWKGDWGRNWMWQ